MATQMRSSTMAVSGQGRNLTAVLTQQVATKGNTMVMLWSSSIPLIIYRQWLYTPSPFSSSTSPGVSCVRSRERWVGATVNSREQVGCRNNTQVSCRTR